MNNNNTSNNQNNITSQSQELKSKRQRRSKHEPEGRSFICEQCLKSYLSKAALTNHFQQKHKDILLERNIQKKGRGRPRRYIIDNQENDQEKEKFNNYFNGKHRRRDTTNDNSNTEDNAYTCFEQAFNALYPKFADKMNVSTYTDWKEYPLFKILISNERDKGDGNSDANDNGNGNAKGNNESCDVIITKYIRTIQPECNDDYYVFVIKFLMLFRECFNTDKKIESDQLDGEASTVYTADKFPELSNNFFCVYLENEKYCFIEQDQDELIEIIQHFCYWLFVNKYTKSRICLSA